MLCATRNRAIAVPTRDSSHRVRRSVGLLGMWSVIRRKCALGRVRRARRIILLLMGRLVGSMDLLVLVGCVHPLIVRVLSPLESVL